MPKTQRNVKIRSHRPRAPRPRRPATLYHFTCRAWWRLIKSEGINQGEIPLAPDLSLNAPNLTTDPDPAHQLWAIGSILDKRAVRIAVAIPPGHIAALESWRDIIKKRGVEKWWADWLNLEGGGGEASWWAYWGTIRPEWFRRVDFLDGVPPE